MRIRLTQRSSRLAIRRCTFYPARSPLRQLPAHLLFQPQAPAFRLRFFSGTAFASFSAAMRGGPQYRFPAY